MTPRSVRDEMSDLQPVKCPDCGASALASVHMVDGSSPALSLGHESDGTHRLVAFQHRDSLDAAWAEAEAALPEGWELLDVSHATTDGSPGWSASAGALRGYTDTETVRVDGPTPPAALRALAAKLRETDS